MAVTQLGFGEAAKMQPPTYPFTPVMTRAIQLFEEPKALPKICGIVAPPGYGKTVLLTQLYDLMCQRGYRCIWVTLDDCDRSLSTLFSLLEAALGLERLDPPVPVDRNNESETFERIDCIVAALSATGQSTMLFIDNVDFCDKPAPDRLLNALVFRTPASLSLVVSSAVPRLPLDVPRALMEMRLRLVGTADLGFDRPAIETLFHQAGIDKLSSDALDLVFEQTEGWPAAVRLMQLIASSDKPIAEWADPLISSHANLAELLSKRLMQTFPPDLVTFLYQIAEFRQFSIELVAYATENERVAPWVSFLVERNVLIIPLNGSRTWFRFHTVFRRFLIDEAARVLPRERQRAILLRGAAWLDAHDNPTAALDLAIRAGDRERCTDFLEKIALRLVRDQGDLPSFLTWVNEARAVGAELGVEAGFWFSWALIFERKFELASAAVHELDGRIEESHMPLDRADNLRAKAGLAQIVLSLNTDTIDTLRPCAEAWLARFTEAKPFEIAAVAGALAWAYLESYDFVAARRALLQSQEAIGRSASDYGSAWVAVIDAALALEQGNPREAEVQLHEAEERVRPGLGANASILAIIALFRARAIFDRGQTREAEQIVADNLVRASRNGLLQTTWVGIEVVLPSAVRGDGPFSVEDLRIIAQGHPRRLSVRLDLATIPLLLRAGRTQEALEHARDLDLLTPSDSFAVCGIPTGEVERELACNAVIYLQIATGHLRKAEELAHDQLQRVRTARRRRAEVSLLLVHADISQRSNVRRQALRSFARAIDSAAAHQLIQPFLEQRALVTDILSEAKVKELNITQAAEISLLNELSRLAGQSKPRTLPREEEDGVLTPPTPREIELLKLLDDGLDNMQIAEALSLSVRTVKWHLTNLYSKLGVKNRSAALAKSRTLRLLTR
jgi:LuxR family maltose regulon positive regulatory protein